MKLKPWLDATPGRAALLAEHLGVTPSMVSQMASGLCRIPPRHYRAIRDFTHNEVTVEDMLPEAEQSA